MLGREEPSHPVQYAKVSRDRPNDCLDVLPQVEVPANIPTQDTEIIP